MLVNSFRYKIVKRREGKKWVYCSLRDEFKRKFPMPKFNFKGKILAAPRTKNYALVGRTFDYVFCWNMERINQRVLRTGTKGLWLRCSRVIDKIDSLCELEDYPEWFPAIYLCDKIQKILAKSEELRLKFKKNGKIDDDLLNIAWSLAQLDAIDQGADFYGGDWEGLVQAFIGLGDVEEEDIGDLQNLISVTDWDIFKAKRICVVHPTLRAMVAVADLLIDDMIIEIKTTKNLRVNRDDFNQLVAYYLLLKSKGSRESPRKSRDVESLGIYYSRYGYLLKIDPKYLMKQSQVPSLIRWVERNL